MTRYSNLTSEQRREYINKKLEKKESVNYRVEQVHPSEKELEQKKFIAYWMVKLNYRIVKESQHSYEPMLSHSHKLKKVPPCKYCAAKKFENEATTLCCRNGKVKLVLPVIPRDLYDLFTSNSQEAKEFQQNVRLYNSIFAFTSFGVKLDQDMASSKKGVYTFRAQGQIYHDLPPLLPIDGNPRFLQLYFYDSKNELQNRMNAIGDGKLNGEILKKLMTILHDNPYAQFFRKLNVGSLQENLTIRIAATVRMDQRVYNSPTVDEVAAIWIEGNNSDIPYERNIIVQSHSGDWHRIKHYYGCYDPLQYPILHPNGESGWHQNIQKGVSRNKAVNVECQDRHDNNQPILTSAADVIEIEQQVVKQGAHVSCREYYAFKLQIREGTQSILLFSGRLLQQFVVDMYIKLESTRLDYYRTQQSRIRSELYQGIVDCVNAGETRANRVGIRNVLPASFIGGPRDMRRRYLDSMALVQRYGKPDIFLTVTCNPEWEEITIELAPGQTPQNRPDLTSRIFHVKLQDLKDQLYKKAIFGKVAAHVHVIEFQKRGLPHAHFLIILKQGHKMTNPDQYDHIVTAEIPDKEKFPELYKLVVKHMMHGPCGKDNEKCPCMINGKCRYHYPRPYSSQTTQGKDGYAIYRRRNDGRQVKARGKTLDNRWVVPYNPYLLTRYNCHINVEICSGLKAVKYLYKYVYKGHDRIAVYIATENGDVLVDEIQQFQDARWVSAQEAIWRIFEFELNEIYPPVINLQLHLPHKQSVTFWENQNLQHVLQLDHISRTMLTEYFNTCSIDEDAKKLLYKEFPEHYVWNNQQRAWCKRKKGQVIGRINAANPREGERYFLRLLLNHVKGPTSFDDLLTVDGVPFSTFKQSAMKRGLLESDQSILECMDEAVTFQMPRELRRLFATLLVYDEPADVKKLWDDYHQAMSEDFKKIDGHTEQMRITNTLKGIANYLQAMGKDIKNYDLPEIVENDAECTVSQCREIIEELDIEIPQEDLDAPSKLNEEQLQAYKKILHRVESRTEGVFFIDGPGGTGKTFLYRALLAYVRKKGMIALATATSGVAASIMPGGRTAHSRFSIPLSPTETSICGLSKQSGQAELLRKAKLIIWDEAPMAKRLAIETVDRTLQDIMSCPNPFGGKVIVFGGDFRQVLPVVPRGTRQQTVNASLVKSYLWPKMEILKLSVNMRASADRQFGEFLLRVGNGEEPTNKEDLITIPRQMVIPQQNKEDSENALIHAIFPDMTTNSSSAKYMMTRAILATTNEYVEQLNDKMISIFPGESKIFSSFDEAVDENNTYYQEEFLNTLMPNGLPPHKLELKVNCPIILLRNLDPSNGLCNGTRMICKNFERNVIHAEITMGQHSGKQVLLPRIPLSPAENEGYPFQFKRKQFPIRLCFAMTINKAQGQTIPNVGVYLPQYVFSHGQLYVALSRGVSMDTTKILIKNEKQTRATTTMTRNVVYKEVLLR